jgi:hypothetical protein
MTPVLVSVDKAGDLKIGSKKCRLYKKDEVVKVAKKYGISTEKKTVKQLCGSIKGKAKNSMNNVPLAKMYPEAAKKRFPDFFKVSENLRRLREKRNEKDKKRAEKKALDKKVAANFMRNMTTPVKNPKVLKVALPLTKNEAIKRIMAMKGLQRNAKMKLVNRVNVGAMSPRRVVKVARELSRLNAPAYRIVM